MTEDTPRVFQHALALYEQMEKSAEDGIYIGSLVGAFRAIGISQAYYSRLYRTLKEMGSIEVLHSARGGGKSRVKLNSPPDLAGFEQAYTRSLTNDSPAAKLLQRVENIEGRLPNINLQSYIAETEGRLSLLEKRVEALEQGEA